ncbi:MAG: calcium-binding protein [Bauldia sp.]|nr:calcium-binding protein [Bauldia sp.]
MPYQTTDILAGSGYAIEYQAAGTTWVVARDVMVAALGFSAIQSTHDNSTLVNRGFVWASSSGVEFLGNNSTVTNKTGATITGTYGIYFGGTAAFGATVVNDGTIAVPAYGILGSDIAGLHVTNTGKIIGGAVGVGYATSTPGGTEGALIKNAGLIKSEVFGVYAETLDGLTTTVVNQADGVLQGGVAAIRAVSGQLMLKNKGTIVGDVLAESAGAHDKIINKGKIDGVVQLGSGDDVYRGKDGKAGLVYSGDGNDKLVAGDRKDKFVFDTGLDEAANVDKIKRFEPGHDELHLSKAVFAALTGPGGLQPGEFRNDSEAQDTNDFILFDRKTGALLYDPDGVGGAPAVQFAQLDKGLNLHAGDFVVLA